MYITRERSIAAAKPAVTEWHCCRASRGGMGLKWPLSLQRGLWPPGTCRVGPRLLRPVTLALHHWPDDDSGDLSPIQRLALEPKMFNQVWSGRRLGAQNSCGVTETPQPSSQPETMDRSIVGVAAE